MDREREPGAQGSQCAAHVRRPREDRGAVEDIHAVVRRQTRPAAVITGCPPTMISDGRQYTIGIGDVAGRAIERVVLMRAGSPTHSFDADQRLIQLDIVSKTPRRA